ncbi:hypothetical protein BH10ACT1_BH10ACT1_02170 [soil metagenome]
MPDLPPPSLGAEVVRFDVGAAAALAHALDLLADGLSTAGRVDAEAFHHAQQDWEGRSRRWAVIRRDGLRGDLHRDAGACRAAADQARGSASVAALRQVQANDRARLVALRAQAQAALHAGQR